MRFALSKEGTSRWNAVRLCAVLCCVSVLSASSGRAGEGGYGTADDARLRLFYLYSPEAHPQQERLAFWQRLSTAPMNSFDVIGVVWPRSEGALPREWPASVPVVEHAADGGDYAVLVYPDARIHSHGSGSDMERVVRSLSGARVSTDVDESTWGKIKELFH